MLKRLLAGTSALVLAAVPLPLLALSSSQIDPQNASPVDNPDAYTLQQLLRLSNPAMGTGSTVGGRLIMVHAASNAIVAKMPAAIGYFHRDGFAAPNDGGAADYTAKSGACPLNGGAGDGGSQLPMADGCALIDWASVGNVATPKLFGAVATSPNGGGDSTAIQAAVATGRTVYIPAGSYSLAAPITHTTPGQVIYGDGRTITKIYATNVSAITSAKGVMIAATGEAGPQWRDIGVYTPEGDAGNGAPSIAYPPDFYVQATPRFVLERAGCYSAVTCVDMRGNSGGAYIKDFQMSALTAGILIDGSLDTVRLEDIHGYIFTLTSNQTNYSAANVVWVSSGKMDDLKASGNMFYQGTAYKFFPSTAFCTPPAGVSAVNNCVTTGTIIGQDFDGTQYGIIMSGGQITVSGGYAALGAANGQFISLTNYAHLTLDSVPFSYSNNGASSTTPQISVAGPGADLTLVNTNYIGAQVDQPILTCTQGNVIFSNNRIEHGQLSANLATPMVNITPGAGQACRLTAIGNSVLDPVSAGSNRFNGPFLYTAVQDYNTIVGNIASG